MKNPPILISVLGFFAAMAGVAWLFFGLRLIGFDWFKALGDVPAFEHVGIWGLLCVLAGIAWLMAAFGLWSLQPWAWAFAMVVAGFAIVEGFLWMVQYPGSGIGLGMILMPGLIVLYLLSREVKDAFGMTDAAAPEPRAS